MKNLLSITALLAASFCFAGSIANERTGTVSVSMDQVTNLTNDQDTIMNRRQNPANNRKRDIGDTSQMRPERTTDTTNLKSAPVEPAPGSMPKHRT